MKSIYFVVIIGFCFLLASTNAKKGLIKSGFKPKIRRPSIPLIVPVIIPVSRGYGYNSYNRLQCYSCEGKDNDPCVLNPSSVARRVTCRSNHFCNVLRVERTITNQVTTAKPGNASINLMPTTSTVKPSAENTTSDVMTIITEDVKGENSSLSSSNSNSSSVPAAVAVVPDTLIDSILKIEDTTEPSNTNTTRPPRVYFKSASVIVSRGCRPMDFVESTIGTEAGLKKYTQFCSRDYCNSGDGRLQCYECQGKGRDQCMLNPSGGGVSKIVTCPPSHYCSIILKQTTNNATGAVVSIKRGCKSLVADDSEARTDGDGQDDAGDDDDDGDVRTLSRSCSSDLCNIEDGYKLYLVNSVPAQGMCLQTFVLTTILAFLIGSF